MPHPQKIPGSILKAARGLPAARAEAARLGLALTADALRVKPPVPESQNAAPLYRRIGTLLAEERKRGGDTLWDGYLKPTRTEQNRVAAKAVVQRLGPVFTLAQQAAARPGCDYTRQWEKGAEVLFPEYARLRELARLLAAQALLQIEAGDPLAAAETLRVAGVVARHINEPTLIAFIVQVAVAAIAVIPFTELLNRFGDRTEVIAAAERANAAFANQMDVEHALRGEAWFGVWRFEQYRRGLLTDNDLIGEEIPPNFHRPTTPAARKAYADAWEAHFLECYNQIVAASRKPGSTPRTQRLLAKSLVEEIERRYQARDVSYLAPAFNVPVLGQTFLIALRGLTEVRLRRVALSALQVHIRTGQYPEALPLAVNDPFTDTPLRYRRYGPDGFIVYSVSTNGRDDGGDSSHDTGPPNNPQDSNDGSLRDISLRIHRPVIVD